MKSIKINLLITAALSTLTISCGKVPHTSPVGARSSNLSNTQTAIIPAGASTSVSQRNIALIGTYALNKIQCYGLSGSDAGLDWSLPTITGYTESVTITNSNLVISGGTTQCSYTVDLAIAALDNQAFYATVQSFQAFRDGVNITASLSTDPVCQGVVSNLSSATVLTQISYTYTAESRQIALSYPTSTASYCGTGNREEDSYQK